MPLRGTLCGLALLCAVELRSCAADGAPSHKAPVGPDFARLELHPFDDADAVCMDGSRAGIYVPLSNESLTSTIYIIYLEGGGWCFDAKSCGIRCEVDSTQDPAMATIGPPFNCSSELATSKGWAPYVYLDGLLSTNGTKTPMPDANKFFVKYCSGDAFMGNRNASSATGGFVFRGQRILDAALSIVIGEYGLGSSPGHQLLLAGGAAGARGVMANIDRVAQDQLKGFGAKFDVRVRGFMDSPFWVETDDDADIRRSGVLTGLASQTQAAYDLLGASDLTPDSCRDTFGGADEWRCAFAQDRMAYVQTPYLLVASQDDLFQIYVKIGHWPHTRVELEWAAAFARRTRAALSALVAQPSFEAGTSAVFSPACPSHSASLEADYYLTTVNGFTTAQALTAFMMQSNGTHSSVTSALRVLIDEYAPHCGCGRGNFHDGRCPDAHPEAFYRSFPRPAHPRAPIVAAVAVCVASAPQGSLSAPLPR